MLQVLSLKDRFLVYILYFPSILLMYLHLWEVQTLAGSDRSSSIILNIKGIQTVTKGQETLERSASEIWHPPRSSHPWRQNVPTLSHCVQICEHHADL
jgi:hypothetical protein